MGYPEDTRDFLLKHKESLLSDLQKLTKDFAFKPSDEPGEGSRKSRLEKLFTDVRKIALKAFSRMPWAIRRAEDKNDWIQDAFEIFCRQTLEYRCSESYYDVYIKDIVRRRLIDKQRAAYRNNPVAKAPCKAGPAMPSEGTAEDPPGGLEEVQPVVIGTVPGMFGECDREKLENLAKENVGIGEYEPEKKLQDKELMSIVLRCLEKLKPYERGIVIDRYLYEETYTEIAKKRVPKTLEALRSQARRGLRILKDCVLERSGAGVPA